MAKNVAAGPMAAIAENSGNGQHAPENMTWGEYEVDGIDLRWGPDETAMFLASLEGHEWDALYTQYVYTAARRF